MNNATAPRKKNAVHNIDQLILRHRDAYMNYKELANRCTVDIKLAGKVLML